MAEKTYGVLNTNEARAPQAAYADRDNDSAGFMMAYKLATGTLRGAQGVGGQGVVIDSENRRITITGDDGTSVGLGIIPGALTELGFFSLNDSGNVSMKIVNGNWYLLDSKNNASAFFGRPPGFTEPVIIIVKEDFDALQSVSS